MCFGLLIDHREHVVEYVVFSEDELRLFFPSARIVFVLAFCSHSQNLVIEYL